MYLIDLPLVKTPQRPGDEFLEALRKLVHKLSQPMTSLCGSAEVALMGEIGEPECRQVLEQSLEEFCRMTEILEDLREVIEIEGAGEDVQPVSWKQAIEKSLKEADLVGKSLSVELVCDVINDVCVKANPQLLERATRRLLRLVINGAHGEYVIRVGLSVGKENACLTIYDQGLSPHAEAEAGTGQEHVPPVTSELSDLEWWMVHRAVKRLSGSLKINRVSANGRSYELRMPLSSTETAGKARPPRH